MFYNVLPLLCGSDGGRSHREVLTTSSDEHRLLSPLELREKHVESRKRYRISQTYGAVGCALGVGRSGDGRLRATAGTRARAAAARAVAARAAP